jgi:Domain of unknown function (DUF4333)
MVNLLRPRDLPVTLLFGLLLATTLTGCGKTLDVSKIQDAIKEDVVKKGATSLKQVFCPKDVKPEAGKTFECVGELDGGTGFVISVTQEDADGKVKWDIPNSKGILNLEKLQALFLESIKTTKGGPPEINCGGIYRSVKPGDTFDCVVTVKPKSTDKADKDKTDKSDKTAKADGTDGKATEAAADDAAKTVKPAASSDSAKADQADSKTAKDKSESGDKSKDTDKKDADKKDADKKTPDKQDADKKAPDQSDTAKGADKSKTADNAKGDKSKVPPGQLVAIRISVDVDGNITWQQILEDSEVKVAATTPATATPASTAPDAAAGAVAGAGGGTTGGTAPKPEDSAAKPGDGAAKPKDGAEPEISTDAADD